MPEDIGQHAGDSVETRHVEEKRNRQQLHVRELAIIDGRAGQVADQVVAWFLAPRVDQLSQVPRNLLLSPEAKRTVRVGRVAGVHQLINPSQELARLLDGQTHDLHEDVRRIEACEISYEIAASRGSERFDELDASFADPRRDL